ncbi:biofilm regulation diguanylate cyclase SiaD [Chitinimonas taiwanensis]|jgi:diguanylate cyclase (GGDEF)-like protein|uniref:diguanylate cyclase n=1 Tax=Chitinimonas taiwanensis DSM 18899 TaxID=1121279 RepID=A0A1K2HIL7_9NEIS|nr:biofilm regulation diguanylate cyclase SiaD [Chitinimonas taiwanensis]SFZ76541.1 diguanylate cyclase (GGDEF) domain-containing protein [Chitinimonas taiwanensis DSM 18899]
MTREHAELEELIKRLLADPEHRDNPLSFALGQLWHQYRELLNRMERITRVSDVYQSLARQREQTLAERFDKQLRQLEKVARISDRYQGMMRELNLALKEASTHDPLTTLANRRPLIERMKAEVERSTRLQHTFCVAMLDIDHFKQVNDQHGHEVGDSVLIETARVMEAEVREYDLCGRWGGEEFLILLPETELATASTIVERVRDSIRRMTLRLGTETLAITISAGLAEHRVEESYSATLNRADAALLEAKRAGRDRAHLAS